MPSILLCRDGADAAAAATFAYAEARGARATKSEAERVAARVKAAYDEACRAFLLHAGKDGARPALRLTLERETLSPKFELVTQAGRNPRGTPRALRALRVRAFLEARAARRPSPLDA